jgi:hypothetical protein
VEGGLSPGATSVKIANIESKFLPLDALKHFMSQTLPPASFTTLIQMLATQTMVALGKIPIPGQSETKIELAAAKHFIDLLEVLEPKTKGNLTGEELILLNNVTHELRMAYIAASKA